MSTSRHLWTRDLLVRLEAPGSLENAVAIISQIQAEGGTARFNPLNTTLKMKGSTPYNSTLVQNFTSYAQGLEATVRTLRQPNMHRLLAVLERGTNAHDYWTALGISPWGTKPPGHDISGFLDDVRRNWYARCMIPVSGT